MENLEKQFAEELSSRNNEKLFTAKCVINSARTILSALNYECGPVEEIEMGDSQWSFTCDSKFIDEESGNRMRFVVGVDIHRNGYLFATADNENYTVSKDSSGSGPLAIFAESGLLIPQ